jgi:hypothetical protein
MESSLKKIFWYGRGENNRPIITVCLMLNGTKWSRGVAICSMRDNPCKKTGRKISETRARWALENKKNNCEIKRMQAINPFLEVIDIVPSTFEYFKSYYKPQFLPIEEKILSKGAS